MKFNFDRLSAPGLMATLSGLGLVAAAPFVVQNTTVDLRTIQSGVYKCYSGDNSAYPASSSWIGFETMWSERASDVQNSCANMASWGGLNQGLFNPAAILTGFQMTAMHDGILEAASTSGVSAEFIFAIILQESNGCLSVRTTNNGVTNPGLMQCHNGSEFVGNDKSVDEQVASIKQMIREGTVGTPSGDGLKQCMAHQGGGVFAAAREYNSGSIAQLGNLNEGNGATASYVCDVANQLMGTYVWNGFVTSGC
jgi:hypothetical protein